MSGMCLEGVWKAQIDLFGPGIYLLVSECCLDCVWRVSGKCMQGVWKVEGRCFVGLYLWVSGGFLKGV